MIAEALLQIALAYALFAALFAVSKHPLARALILLPLTYFFIILVKAAWGVLAEPLALLATAAAVAALIASIARSGRGCAVDPAAAGAQRSPPARPPSSALSFSASSRTCSLCASKLRRDRRQG